MVTIAFGASFLRPKAVHLAEEFGTGSAVGP
jgi:hypothetical protein